VLEAQPQDGVAHGVDVPAARVPLEDGRTSPLLLPDLACGTFRVKRGGRRQTDPRAHPALRCAAFGEEGCEQSIGRRFARVKRLARRPERWDQAAVCVATSATAFAVSSSDAPSTPEAAAAAANALPVPVTCQPGVPRA
jgi:hypothetical protein